MVPILVTVSQANKSRDDSTSQSALNHLSTSGRHSDHAEKQSSTRSDSTEEFLKRIIQKAELPSLSGSHDISILGEETSNSDLALTKSHGTNFSMENVETSEESLSSIEDRTKNLRSARDTLSRMSAFQQLPSYNLSHLSEQCPYADICNNQKRELPQKSFGSCCLPCSCDSTCGKIGNCCDKRENSGYMCHYPIVQRLNSNELGYFMIDNCLDGSDKDCTVITAAPWGSLYPVYDPALNMNFYNPQCAECNGVKDYSRWDINLVCSKPDVNNEYYRSALRGQVSEECKIKFTPPRTMAIPRHVCSGELINRCNVTGFWKAHNAELEEACTRWYSPVVSRRGYLKYANIYCKLCNGGDYDPEEHCVAVRPEKITSLSSHAFIIDYRRVSALVDKRMDNSVKSAGNGGCGKDMVKHISKVSETSSYCKIMNFYEHVRVCGFLAFDWSNFSFICQ